VDENEVAKLTSPVSERDHIQGSDDAPVTLVEYGDYECPDCGNAFPVVKEVQARMGNRLRYVYRHFPLSKIHPHAQHAAETAEGAGAQGKFWEMHDTLFENRAALDDPHLMGYIRDLGLDTQQFGREMAGHVHTERVREDFKSGVRSGVNGTPTFFINGIRFDREWNVESLVAALEEATG